MGHDQSPAPQRFMIFWLWVLIALAVTPDEVQARLAEIEPLRAMRITRKPPKMSAGEIRKAASGSIVTGLRESSSGPSKAYGVALIKLPISKLWAALNDETRHPGYTAVAYSELIKGSPCRSGRRVLQFLPVPMIDDRWWIGILTINQKLMTASGGSVRELSWRSSINPAEITTASGKKIIQKAEPIGFSAGGWFLVAMDQRTTYAEYYVVSDPGAGVPSSIASRLAKSGVAKNIEAIVRFAREGNPSCPIH